MRYNTMATTHTFGIVVQDPVHRVEMIPTHGKVDRFVSFRVRQLFEQRFQARNAARGDVLVG